MITAGIALLVAGHFSNALGQLSDEKLSAAIGWIISFVGTALLVVAQLGE